MRAILLKRALKSAWFLVTLGLILGALIILGIRYFTYKPDRVHYHANFAVYIKGQQEQFKGPLYYEETEMCAANTVMIPGMRAHMHDKINNVVHVEDRAVTWGQFFENLNWYVGSDYIKAFDKLYLKDDQHTLSIIINGQDIGGISSISNRVIQDQDKLLVDYGNNTNDQLQKEYKSIPSTAHKYDVSQDPKSCSGHSKSSTHDRLVHIL